MEVWDGQRKDWGLSTAVASKCECKGLQYVMMISVLYPFSNNSQLLFCLFVLSIELIFLFIYSNSKILLLSLVISLEAIVSYIWSYESLLHFWVLIFVCHLIALALSLVRCSAVPCDCLLPSCAPGVRGQLRAAGAQPLAWDEAAGKGFQPAGSVLPCLLLPGQIWTLCVFILTRQLPQIIEGKIKCSSLNFPCIN